MVCLKNGTTRWSHRIGKLYAWKLLTDFRMCRLFLAHHYARSCFIEFIYNCQRVTISYFDRIALISYKIQFNFLSQYKNQIIFETNPIKITKRGEMFLTLVGITSIMKVW